MIKSNLIPYYHKHQLLKECHTCLTRVLEARFLVQEAIPIKRETKNQIWHENKFIGTQTAVWKLHMVMCMLWMSKTAAWKSTAPCGNPTRPCRCSILSIHLAGNSHIHLICTHSKNATPGSLQLMKNATNFPKTLGNNAQVFLHEISMQK